jgi:hypothetical protein
MAWTRAMPAQSCKPCETHEHIPVGSKTLVSQGSRTGFVRYRSIFIGSTEVLDYYFLRICTCTGLRYCLRATLKSFLPPNESILLWLLERCVHGKLEVEPRHNSMVFTRQCP